MYQTLACHVVREWRGLQPRQKPAILETVFNPIIIMQITLPDDLARQIEARVAESKEFHDVDKYVAYILEQVMKQAGGTSTDSYSTDKEDAVKKRLEDLGYLD